MPLQIEGERVHMEIVAISTPRKVDIRIVITRVGG